MTIHPWWGVTALSGWGAGSQRTAEARTRRGQTTSHHQSAHSEKKASASVTFVFSFSLSDSKQSLASSESMIEQVQFDSIQTFKKISLLLKNQDTSFCNPVWCQVSNSMSSTKQNLSSGSVQPNDTIYLCNFRVSVDGEWLCLKVSKTQTFLHRAIQEQGELSMKGKRWKRLGFFLLRTWGSSHISSLGSSSDAFLHTSCHSKNEYRIKHGEIETAFSFFLWFFNQIRSAIDNM